MKDVMMVGSYDRNIWYNRFYLYDRYMWMDEECVSRDLELKADPKFFIISLTPDVYDADMIIIKLLRSKDRH